MTKNKSGFSRWFHHEATPGVLLMLAMVMALVVANSGATWYGQLLSTKLTMTAGGWGIDKALILWINDGLMAVFFLLVGLELKREVLYGALSERKKVILPLAAALGGIAIPSGIYAFINWGDPVAINGWAIPAATDIAFALGVLAILGSRVPIALKILLTSVAVIDDLAAIVIIALFYTDQLSVTSLLTAVIMLLSLFSLNKAGVRNFTPYVLVGFVLWIAVLKSGVHATLAGVALAAFIPTGDGPDDKNSLMYRMEHGLHPWVIFGVLPVFAFANAGVPLAGLTFASLLEPIPLGIALGLFLGKQIGIFGASYIAVKSGLATLPQGLNWRQIYGLSALCGIGFTMSLFIGGLAFEPTGDTDMIINDRIGILAGSFLSAVLGVALLLKCCPKAAARAAKTEL